jgi:5-formyltetrahydrofolate cyclo-ligase
VSADNPIAAQKRALRHTVRARRDALSAPARAHAADLIADIVDREVFANLPSGATVALYADKDPEVPTAPIAARVAACGFRLVYPRVVPNRLALDFHQATPGDLVPGVFGLREPRPTAPRVALADIAVVIVPGVAFDRAGRRLGWGRGHYDATLAAADRTAALIGIAFDCQLVDHIPTHAGDVSVDAVVTELGARWA